MTQAQREEIDASHPPPQNAARRRDRAARSFSPLRELTMADDRDDLFGDAHGEGRTGDPDRWPRNEEGPAGDVTGTKSGKSGTVKVLLILLAVFVLLGVVCCGVGVWLFSKSFEQTTDAATIRSWTQEIVSVEIPEEGFPPAVGVKMNWFGTFAMNMVVYGAPGGGTLTFANIGGQVGNDPQARQQLDVQMRQQGATHQINVTDTQTKTVEIGGEQVEFTVGTGTESQSNAEWKEVTGTFPGRDGIVTMKLQQPSSSYDEEQITAILESIETD